jgi:hypothetical protein
VIAARSSILAACVGSSVLSGRTRARCAHIPERASTDLGATAALATTQDPRARRQVDSHRYVDDASCAHRMTFTYGSPGCRTAHRTGDLSTLGHRDGGAPELAICSMHARTEGVPERARDRATPVPPNAGMMAHGVAAHPLRASLCGLAATGNRLSASGQFAMAANISLRSAAMVHVASDECCPPGGRRGGARRSAPEGDELGDTGWMRKRSFG